MRTVNIEKPVHDDLKRLAIDMDRKIQEIGNEAVLIGIEKMRERLEATLKKRKAKR